MSQTILGVDIGSYSVKVTELSRSFKDFELLHFYEQPINLASRLSFEEASASALKTLMDVHGLTSDVVSVSLPAQLVSCRVLELPFTNIKKIEQTVEFELEGYIPMGIDELLVDYHILSIEENRSMVLTSYIPKARLVRFLDMLQMAGVDPKYVGVDNIDLSNIAQIAMVPNEAVYAIMDIGHSKTNICVMEGQRLRYVRSVPFGGVHFTRAIQKAFKLNHEKAEALKIERGKVSSHEEELDQISRICQKVAEELVIAIRQTYLGYKQIYAKKNWEAIFLTGGGSRLAGMYEFLSTALRLNVVSLDFLDVISHKLDQPELMRDILAPSVAQTLRVIFSNKAIKINFRKGDFAFHRDIKALGAEIRDVGLWVAALCFLGISYFFVSQYALSERIEKINQGLIASATKSIPDITQALKKKGDVKNLEDVISGRMAEINPQLEALRSGSTGMTALKVLNEISKIVPAKSEVVLDIDDFTFTGDHLNMDGRTNSYEAVDKIKAALAKSPHFKNIDSRNVTKGIKDEIKFSISMDVVEGEDG